MERGDMRRYSATRMPEILLAVLDYSGGRRDGIVQF